MDKYIDALYKISPDIPRDEWVKTAMASKNAGIDFSTWDNWSSSGMSYDPKSAKSVWNSADPLGGIKAGTLFYMAGFNTSDHKAPISDFKDLIQTKPHTAKENATIDVQSLFESYLDANLEHEYIALKQGITDGLKIVPNTNKEKISGINLAGALVIPCKDGDTIETLQYITPQGKKLNLKDVKFNNGYFMLGDDKADIYICEGIGQAWVANKATNKAAVSTFGLMRTERIVKAIKLKYPDANLIICADAGQESTIEKTARENKVKFIIMPQGWDKNSDINDLMIRDGIDALSELLSKPVSPLNYDPEALKRINERTKSMMATNESIKQYENLKHHIDGIALQAHHTVIYGGSGSFKTTFITALCFDAIKKDLDVQVHYWGFDVSPPYSQAVVKLVSENNLQERFYLFADKTINELKEHYSDYLIGNIRMDNLIIVLDTYKFLSANVNDKNANKEAMHYIKSFCKLGAAWISIAHANKDNEKQSGTAEIEQDSDGLLRIDSVINDGKGTANIKKGGRCRWGEPNLTIETIIIEEDKANPSFFWYEAIKNSQVIGNVDIEKNKYLAVKAKEIEIIAEIIAQYQKENFEPIGKTELLNRIKEHDLLDLSKAERNKILDYGEGKYWRTERDKAANNKLLYIPIDEIDFSALLN